MGDSSKDSDETVSGSTTLSVTNAGIDTSSSAVSSTRKGGKGSGTDVPKKSFMLWGIIIVTAVVSAGGFVLLNNIMMFKDAALEAEWDRKQEDYRTSALRRMYDSQQSHMQTDMMDQIKIQKKPPSP